MIKTFRMLIGLLTARERRKFSWLVLVMLLVGIFETAGVASILPFMAVLAEPDRIQTSAQLSAIYDALNFTSVPGFLIFLGLGTFVMTMMGIGMHLLSLYTITRFNHECSYMLSCQLLRRLPEPALCLVPQPPQRRSRQGGALRGRPGRLPVAGAGDGAARRTPSSRSSSRPS